MKCFYRHAATVLALLLIATSGTLVPEATAQSAWDTASPDQHDERTQYEAPRPDDPVGSGLPDWADSGAFEGESNVERYDFGAGMNQGGGGLPSDPDQVPVDGGLSLLALVGAGYAAHKLRRRDEDEDESGDMP